MTEKSRPSCFGKYNPRGISGGCLACEVSCTCYLENKQSLRCMGSYEDDYACKNCWAKNTCKKEKFASIQKSSSSIVARDKVVVGADGKVRRAKAGEVPCGIAIGVSDDKSRIQVVMTNGSFLSVGAQEDPKHVRVLCLSDEVPFAKRGIICFALRYTDRLMFKTEEDKEVDIGDALCRGEFIELPEPFFVVRCDGEQKFFERECFYVAYRPDPEYPSDIVVLDDEGDWVKSRISNTEFFYLSDSFGFGAGSTQLSAIGCNPAKTAPAPSGKYECVLVTGMENRLSLGKVYSGAAADGFFVITDDNGREDSFLPERFKVL